MARSLRPRALAAGFGIYFLLVGFFSWGFAQTLSGPWYPPDITRWVYTTYMLVAAIFLGGLGGLGVSIRRSFTRQIRELERKVGSQSNDVGTDALPPPLPETVGVRDHVDRDIDELLESLSEIEATSAREAAAMEVEAATPGGASGSSSGGGSLATRRSQLITRQKYLGAFLLGPGLVAALILGVSGMMLPGADGFAQYNYQLNTALILGISYAWIGVGAYVAATVYALASRGKK